MSRRVLLWGHHDDRAWIERLQEHLQPYEARGLVTVQSSEDLPAGARRGEAREAAFAAAETLVLLVSPVFLADDDLTPDGAVMRLVRVAAARGVRIGCVHLAHSAHQDTELAGLRALGDPRRPLEGLAEAERKQVLVELCKLLAGVGAQQKNPMERRAVASIVVGALVGVGAWFAGVGQSPPPPPEQREEAPPPGPTLLAPGGEHRPLIRVIMDPRELEKLGPITRVPDAKESEAPAKAVPGARPIRAPKPRTVELEQVPRDPAEAGRLAAAVAAVLRERLPLFRFAADDSAGAADARLVLSLATAPEQRLEASVVVEGAPMLRKRWTLCPLTDWAPSDHVALDERFAACRGQIEQAVDRWDENIRDEFGRVPFKAAVEVVGPVPMALTALRQDHLSDREDPTRRPVGQETAIFAVMHERDGELPFRVCERERIGGYLFPSGAGAEWMRRRCRDLGNAKDAWREVPAMRGEQIFLRYWGGDR